MRADSAVQRKIPAGPRAVIDVLRPAVQTAPLVFCSPHSGNDYPAEFVSASRLDPLTLRRSEDSFIDEIFAAAPRLGAPLLKALFPRAYCDPNREPWELDQGMFDEPLPDFTNTSSARVAGGLGTIARVVANGAEIYRHKLTWPEAKTRIDEHWRPYHEALSALVDETVTAFGGAIVIDCHSMPSVGGPMDRDPGHRRPDIVLGNRHGLACAAKLIDTAAAVLSARGFLVSLNNPYAGAYTTQQYGKPDRGLHAMQIEINRALYMDEARIERRPGIERMTEAMTELVAVLATLEPAAFPAR